ncbi:hypothetical protein MFMK1_001087 [Metallumcola ferriviriculae]|uniref:Cardiolipin synthase N-terminal domain-containing protein n=1 Tax=Metallumcola ferriviriculae TaxID=3039180 RepID=A0AAU0UM90_9FIRM|nr:hypothetical protein MFMK1_001087 [Desulfitibacteraceae bacterium MK1]
MVRAPWSVFSHFGIPFFVITFILAMFAVTILVGIWIYRDAQSRGLSGPLWLVVWLVANFIGLIIYLIVRNDYQQGMRE